MLHKFYRFISPEASKPSLILIWIEEKLISWLKLVENRINLCASFGWLWGLPRRVVCYLSNSYTIGCLPVRGDIPRALASALYYEQVDKHCITILHHLHQTLHIVRHLVLNFVRVVQSDILHYNRTLHEGICTPNVNVIINAIFNGEQEKEYVICFDRIKSVIIRSSVEFYLRNPLWTGN